MKINLMNVKIVVSVFVKVQACGAIAKFTLEKSHLNVKSGELFLAEQDTLGYMKGFTTGKSLMNVNSVVSVLADQTT